MDKMKLESADITVQNIEKIAELFPNCITETEDENGNLKKAINFDILKQDLSKDLVKGKECYEFTWVGKKESIIEANRPIRKTLRPCKEDSVNWDTTENLYIEGDNLEVLKLLQESYLGKVKMIYIDPPYNTGNDFIYPDNYKMTDSDFNRSSDYFDEEGNIKFTRTNTESEGKFHSDWCSMIYSRLMLARNLLSENGVIFISIDDNEQENLNKICEDVFGCLNFLAQFTVVVKTEGRRYGGIAKTHEYILAYAKDLTKVELNEIEREGKSFKFFDEFGGFNIQELRNQNARAFNSSNRPNLRYPFYVDENNIDKNGFFKVELNKIEGWTEVFPIIVNGFESVWRWGRNEKAKDNLNDLIARKGSDGVIRIYQKMRKLTEMPKTVLFDKNYISIKGTRECQSLLGLGIFDFPKPTMLIKLLENIATSEECIILDFFSGSSTTAHAVMLQNAEDGGKRKFIMVQLPEPCDEKSEAIKAGNKNICEIGKERIRRAAKKIAEDNPNAKFDGGFRVFKVDDSNMKDVYYAPAEYSQSLLDKLESNIKDDRTDLDLFFGCILDWGLPLNLSYTSESIENCSVHTYSDNALIACFNDNIPESVIKEIAKRKPLRVVFRDSSFADTPSKINVTEIFKLLSPDTRVKVI